LTSDPFRFMLFIFVFLMPFGRFAPARFFILADPSPGSVYLNGLFPFRRIKSGAVRIAI
jgi:hypothetical protein